MSVIPAEAEFSVGLRRSVKKVLKAGVAPRDVMRRLIEEAHEAMQTGPGDSRQSAAEAVLHDAMRLHTLYGDPDKTA